MIIAKEKRNQNIAEYVLYMWQVEDTLRALKLDMNLVEKYLITQFKQPPDILDQIKNWYADVILSMHEEGIKESGHLKIVQGITDELFELHKRLIHETKDAEYSVLYTQAESNIKLFRDKLLMPDANDVEVCFYGLYGLLLLRLKKKQIFSETTKAMECFGNLLAYLSTYFHKIEKGEIEF